MHRSLILVASLILPSLALAGCQGGETAVGESRPAVSDEIVTALAHGGPVTIRVEVARTPSELSQGLRRRPVLASDAGMLFDLGTVRLAHFTMADTLIPLDMLFIDADGIVRHRIINAVPGTPGPYSSKGPVRAVLELNGGSADRLGILEGTAIQHPLFGQKAPAGK